MRSATIGWTGHELNEFLSSDWRTRLITWMNADMGPDPLWLRGQGQAEAVAGDRTATTPTTTETSHEPPDKDDNTTFTRHLAGASRQIDTTVPMGRTSAHSSPRRALGTSPKARRTSREPVRTACLLCRGQRYKQPGANRGRYARPHLRRRSAYGSVRSDRTC